VKSGVPLRCGAEKGKEMRDEKKTRNGAV